MALQCKSGVFGKAAVARPVRVAAVSRTRPAFCAPVTRSRTASTVVCQAATEFKGDLLNKSYYPTSADAAAVNKRWYVIDAEGQTLGRLATLAATYIRGKHLPTYTPSMDMGAYVIVLNADKVTVSGKKSTKKTYFRHVTGRPGSWTSETFTELQARLPERIIERAVKGMLPKGAIGRNIKLHLKVYTGAKHEHEAQQPQDITKEISIKPKNGPGAAVLAAKKA
ncbi:hypothetical protein HYH03_015052 [Edaphochlamys debaryana]|uniref:Uncharacterized protein n=1 Tax=Edaphochlamys debaryana TaxID=47281 RepID=A0A835XK55_9CHLO|nr:hypothetical protein HYH03_015052 [Edaphochlamys debaryana]|eukprot:KAG2486227.1 hypothetical protein HYH03_015052 [Edaphochlamys debaryana]